MYTHDVDQMRQQAQDRQETLLKETHTCRLLQLQRHHRPTLYRRLCRYVGMRLVAWGNRLQQQPGAVTHESFGV